MDTWQEIWGQIALIGIFALPLIVIYYVLLVRAVLEMLRRSANPVLMAFALGALIPFPPLMIMGVLVLIIWKMHKKTPQTS